MEIKSKKEKLEMAELYYCRACSKFKTCVGGVISKREKVQKPDEIPLPRLCNDGENQLALEAEEKRERENPIRAFVEVCANGSFHVWVDAILADGKVLRLNGGSVASTANDKKIAQKINQVLSPYSIHPAENARKDYVKFCKPSFMRV